MSEEVIQATPPELREVAANAVNNLLPVKSKGKYEKEYEKFMSWSREKNVQKITESVLIAYFQTMSVDFKSSTLWKMYLMLKSTLNIRQNVDISKFMKLQSLLKRFGKEHVPKKSQILEYHDIEKCIKEAPDADYLVVKVVLIMGYSGACRRDELCNMLIDDIEYKADSVFVTVTKTKTNHPRLFAITNGLWINLIKKYTGLRPTHTTHKRLFVYYRNGRCTIQPIGINKIAEMPKIIAKYLELTDPEKYSGHCFRRSSASHLANSGGDLITVKQHGGWKSSSVAEGYVEASTKKRIEVANLLSSSEDVGRSCSLHSTDFEGNKENINTLSCLQNLPGISINAGDNANITITVYNTCASD